MEKPQNIRNTDITNDDDIAAEPYKGANVLVSTLGEGAIKHLIWGLTGLGLGAGFALVLRQPAKSFITMVRKTSSEWLAASDTSDLKKGFGKLLQGVFGEGESASLTALKHVAKDPMHAEWLDHAIMNKEHGFGSWMLSHTFGLTPYLGHGLKNWMHNKAPEWFHQVLTFGGLFGAVGYVGGWLKALFKGAEHGQDGERQFDRAKLEIRNLRETNEDLEKINDKLHEKFVEAATQLNDIKTARDAEEGNLRVAKDEPRDMEKEASGAGNQLPDTPDADSGNGVIEEPKIKDPVIKEPVIKEPVIGPASTTGRSHAHAHTAAARKIDADWAGNVQAQKDAAREQPHSVV